MVTWVHATSTLRLRPQFASDWFLHVSFFLVLYITPNSIPFVHCVLYCTTNPYCNSVRWRLIRRLEVPCRGDKCKHTECFDIEAYTNNISKGGVGSGVGARCPVCSEFVLLEDLHFDELVWRLLCELPDSATAVQISTDTGTRRSWHTLCVMPPIYTRRCHAPLALHSTFIFFALYQPTHIISFLSTSSIYLLFYMQ